MKRTVGRLFLILLALVWAGCVSPVKITSPSEGCLWNPVTEFQVTFTSSYNPNNNTFHARLDGQDWTAKFQPPAAPGVTSTAKVTEPYNPKGSIFICKDKDFDVPSNPHPHELRAWATCGFFCVFPTQTVTFVPPRFWFMSNISDPISVPPFSVQVNVPTEVGVGLPCGPSLKSLCMRPNPIIVTLTAIGPISLNNQPPGTPITVTISKQSTTTPFLITGLQAAAEVQVIATALGVDANGFSFSIVP